MRITTKSLSKTLAAQVNRYSHINWALADQTLVSGGNFLTGILLARFLGLSEFGVFTLAWMAVLLANGIQDALVAVPMMSIGPKHTEGDSPSYYASTLIQHFFVAVISVGALLVSVSMVETVFPQWQLQYTSFPLACAAFTFQTQSYLRRYLFARSKPLVAFSVDFTSYIGRIVFLWSFLIGHRATTVDALWIITVATLPAIILGGTQLRPLTRPAAKLLWENSRRHGQFSQWLLPSTIMDWISRNVFHIAAGAFLGSWATGALKAANNIIGITHILFFGLNNVISPNASRIYARHGLTALGSYLRKVAWFVGSATVLFALVFAVAPRFWLQLLYGQAYGDYTFLLRGYALAYVFTALTLPVNVGLRTLETTRFLFDATFLSAFVSVGASIVSIEYFGLSGVPAGIVSSSAVLFGFSLYGYTKASRQRRRHPYTLTSSAFSSGIET